MKRILQPWTRFWAEDKSLTALLILLIIFSFVLPPLAIPTVRRSLLNDITFSLLLVSGMGAVWRHGRLTSRAVASISLCALTVNWLTRFSPSTGFALWNVGADMVALATVATVVLTKVVRPGTITRHRIMGAVAVYLLIGLTWSNAYEFTQLRHPSAFSGAGVGAGQSPSWIYYSFVTLTTMGYGDITPVHPVARSLAIAEALTGQLYIAILISRLVALELSARREISSETRE